MPKVKTYNRFEIRALFFSLYRPRFRWIRLGTIHFFFYEQWLNKKEERDLRENKYSIDEWTWPHRLISTLRRTTATHIHIPEWLIACANLHNLYCNVKKKLCLTWKICRMVLNFLLLLSSHTRLFFFMCHTRTFFFSDPNPVLFSSFSSCVNGRYRITMEFNVTLDQHSHQFFFFTSIVFFHCFFQCFL